MSAPWVGHCTGCSREGVEVASRRTHGERVLCDDCAGKPYAMPSASGVSSGKPKPSAPSDATPAALPAVELATLLDLPSVEVSIVGAEIFGTGSRAALEIALSNGECMTFDTLREMANVSVLGAELAACTGATPKLTRPMALRAIALVRTIARTHRTMTDNDAAVEWGVTYLQGADMLDFDLNDQADRWGSFSALAELDPSRDPAGVPPPNLVLRNVDGTRLVRSSWFVTHVRNMDSVSTRDVPTRMCRVGWVRRGSTGRVKATRPDFKGQLNWSFFFVPEGWEDRAGGYEVTAGVVVNARTQHGDTSRVEAVTSRNRVTEVAA